MFLCLLIWKMGINPPLSGIISVPCLTHCPLESSRHILAAHLQILLLLLDFNSQLGFELMVVVRGRGTCGPYGSVFG